MKNICGIPFSEIAINQDYFGNDILAAVPCCGTWLNQPYSNFCLPVIEDADNNIDIMSTWNSAALKIFRESILDGSYRYCIKESCPFLVTGKLPPVPEIAKPYILNKVTHLEYPPLMVKLGIDKACNLTCPSCRKDKIIIPNKATYPRIISFLKSGVKTITLSSSGEVFVNRAILKIFQEFSREQFPGIEGFRIYTNGTALTKTLWESLSKDFKSLVKSINISVGSPNEATYSKLRVGGIHSILHKNLSHISAIRASGGIEQLTLTCILQKANVAELVDFVNYAIKVKADRIVVHKIELWGHMSKLHFEEHFGLSKDWRIRYSEVIKQAVSLIKQHNIKLFSNIIKLDSGDL